MDKIVSRKQRENNINTYNYKNMREIINKDKITNTLIEILKEDKKINKEPYIIAKNIGVNIFNVNIPNNEKKQLKNMKTIKRDIIKSIKYIYLIDEYMEKNDVSFKPSETNNKSFAQEYINLFKVTYLWELSPIIGIEYEERFSKEKYVKLIIDKINSIK